MSDSEIIEEIKRLIYDYSTPTGNRARYMSNENRVVCFNKILKLVGFTERKD